MRASMFVSPANRAAKALSELADTFSPAVAIIVLNWNGAFDTLPCLESLIRLENAATGIFVCDNASTDSSVADIREWAATGLPAANVARAAAGRPAFRFRDPGARPADVAERSVDAVTLLETGGNLGYAGGNNVGLAAALADGYEFFWVLNNDTEVKVDALSWLLDRAVRDDRLGICGSTLVYARDPGLVQNLGGGSFNWLKGKGAAIGLGMRLDDPIDQADVERRLAFVSGASMLVRRSFLEQVGLMQDDYFLYWEELDWSTRARGRFALGYAPKSIVVHKVGASIGTDDFGGSSPLSEYYFSRNRIRFCWRFDRIALPFVFADLFRTVLRHCMRRTWPQASAALRAAFGLPFRPQQRSARKVSA